MALQEIMSTFSILINTNALGSINHKTFFNTCISSNTNICTRKLKRYLNTGVHVGIGDRTACMSCSEDEKTAVQCQHAVLCNPEQVGRFLLWKALQALDPFVLRMFRVML